MKRGVRRLLTAMLVVLTALTVQVDLGAQPPAQRQAARVDQGAQGRSARERLGTLVRGRLQLTDAQATQLSNVTTKFMRERDDLVRRERDVRIALRAEVAAKDQANQERTGRLLDDMFALQSRRLELVTREQRELAAFLTPLQRAQFIALQEQMQRAVQQTRQRRPGPAARPRTRAPQP